MKKETLRAFEVIALAVASLLVLVALIQNPDIRGFGAGQPLQFSSATARTSKPTAVN